MKKTNKQNPPSIFHANPNPVGVHRVLSEKQMEDREHVRPKMTSALADTIEKRKKKQEKMTSTLVDTIEKRKKKHS